MVGFRLVAGCGLVVAIRRKANERSGTVFDGIRRDGLTRCVLTRGMYSGVDDWAENKAFQNSCAANLSGALHALLACLSASAPLEVKLASNF